MITFAVNENNDIYLDDSGNISTVSGIEALKQKIKQRLKLFLGEWFLDITRGVPYFQNILGDNINTALASQILTNEIMKEPEVTAVNNSSFSLNAQTRKYFYSATVQSIYTTFNLEVKQ